MTQSILAISLILTLLSLSLSATASSCDDPRPLRLALSPIKNPEMQRTQYQPLIERLEKVLQRRVELTSTPSYGTAIEALLAESVDLAELGPASYAIAMSRGARITPFATFSQQRGPHTESSAFYRSLLIARRDKAATSLAQLKNATLALTDPASTSGAILPRQAISKLTGMPLEAYFKRVVYAGSHDRAIDALKKSQVEAAFVASGRLDEALRLGKIEAGDFVLIWTSNPIPYDPFVIRQGLCPALATKIKQVFLGDTSSLKGMFEQLHMLGFVPTSDANYREIKELSTSQP